MDFINSDLPNSGDVGLYLFGRAGANGSRVAQGSSVTTKFARTTTSNSEGSRPASWAIPLIPVIIRFRATGGIAAGATRRPW